MSNFSGSSPRRPTPAMRTPRPIRCFALFHRADVGVEADRRRKIFEARSVCRHHAKLTDPIDSERSVIVPEPAIRRDEPLLAPKIETQRYDGALRLRVVAVDVVKPCPRVVGDRATQLSQRTCRRFARAIRRTEE